MASPRDTDDEQAFRVSLEVFEGPFDLLLSLISKHELDIVDVSLTQVTNEFISRVSELTAQGRLGEVSSFLVMSATLLDIKIASLLPRGEVVDPEDVALLETRDLLLARLLQYRAFKGAAEWIASRLASEGNRIVRAAPLDPQFRKQRAESPWQITPADFAGYAIAAFTRDTSPGLSVEHLHAPRVSIREQTGIIVSRLRRQGKLTFTELISDAQTTGEVVARFLGVLELFRNDAVMFEQVEPLGPLSVAWIAETFNDEQLAMLGGGYEG